MSAKVRRTNGKERPIAERADTVTIALSGWWRRVLKPRVTACLRPDGTFEILLNEAGRDLVVRELQALDRRWDHFHLDHFDDPDLAERTDVPLSVVAYREGDRVLEFGKVLFRPDDWDEQHFPHVMAPGKATP